VKRPFGLHPAILRVAAVHLFVDGYSNIYAPLLPLIIPRLDLSLAAAGMLAMLFQVAASVSQLAFGHLADRWRPRVLLTIGPLVAVSLLPLVGLATGVGALALVLAVGGLGCAAFHPPAAVVAHTVGGERRGLAMSVYITGGTFGFSFGPLLFAPVAQRYGLGATALLSLPALAVVALLLRNIPGVAPHASAGDGGGLRALRPYARPLALLWAIVVLRTFASLAFATFVPVMLTRRGLSLGDAGVSVAAYLAASGVGGFLGGPLADRFGARRVIAGSLLLSTPFLAVAPFLDGTAFTVILALGGMCLQSTLPINVTYGQAIAPVSAATVSSLMMGFAWGTAGFSVPLVGLAADRFGIDRTLVAMSAAPIAAALCAWPLPAHPVPHVPPRPSDVGIPT
jgi:FSR family fosmidomycin resistance protein-like MFS transporter